MMDDIIIFGDSSEEHDARVRAVFRHLEDNGVTLNFEKCEFAKSSITYLGRDQSRSVQGASNKADAKTQRR